VTAPNYPATLGSVAFVDSTLGVIGTATAPYAFGGTAGNYQADFYIPYAYAARGTHSVTAQFQGGTYNGITYFAASPTASAPVAVTVQNTLLTVSPSVVAVYAGGSVIINAYVSVFGATLPNNTYSVNLYFGSTLVGTAQVINGVATIVLNVNLAGSTSGMAYTLSAKFVGDALFDTAFSSLTLDVYTPIASTR
jgi:hypothetical protein